MEREPGTVLLVTPPPTPNGPLHVGHLSGPYVAGDIAARALRADGRTVLTQTGLDTNQNWVLTRAEADGKSPEETARHFSELVRAGFANARVDYDLLVDPLVDNDYSTDVAGLLTELVDNKTIEVAPTQLVACGDCGRTLHHARVVGDCPTCGAHAAGGTCEGCGTFVTGTLLLDATSTCCDAPAVATEHTVPVLRLEDYREQLAEFWSVSVIPPQVRRMIGRYLRDGLPQVPMAYPSDWGIGWDCNGEQLRIDVWAEMTLANLYLPARQLRPGARTVADCVSAWRSIDEQWLFMGIDNAFYYAVLIPAVHLAAGLPLPRTGIVLNEFYLLSGAKFSTSRNYAIWANELLEAEDPGVVRAYLSWDRPDRYGSDFTMDGFHAFRERYLDVLAERGPELSAELADAELTRGEHALKLDGFDPPLAVRAALSAFRADPDRARRLLALIAGTD